MDNRKIKNFNKKLIVAFIAMLAILITLLVSRVNAAGVSAQIQSLKQTDRGNPTYLTYNDLKDYYDMLCCQHRTPLKGEASVILEGSSDTLGAFKYSLGKLTANDIGTKKESHKIYYQGNDFSASKYTHYTYGYYTIAEHHIATPKEAYIVAEMKEELIADGADPSWCEYVKGADGNLVEYVGGFSDFTIWGQLSTGEDYATVNETYVLQTEDGHKYLVGTGKDSAGNDCYVYKLDSDGNIQEYTGDLTYTNSTGSTVSIQGVQTTGVLYAVGGSISSNVAGVSNSGTLYLVNFDTVVGASNGSYYYADVTDSTSYIQLAWWTTKLGTKYGALPPADSNALAKEAEAFEDYMLAITKVSSTDELTYAEQSYSFVEDDGTQSSGSVQAPVIDYNPTWNEDADQNGTINEADEVTVAFNYNTQKYEIGPFSINYVKRASTVDGRAKVDFACITDATLIGRIAGKDTELEFGKDWNFKYLVDQGRDETEDYLYPNPDEVFYIEVKYIADLTEITNFTFDFEYMNAGAELDVYTGTYNTCTWSVKYEDHDKTETYQEYNQETQEYETKEHEVFDYRDIWIELTSVVPNESQMLAHALKGARWYNYTSITKEFAIPAWSTITINKTSVGEDGEKVKENETYYFVITVNDVDGAKEIPLSVKVKNGYGTATTSKIYWDTTSSAPTYTITEVGDYSNNGPWSGSLASARNADVTIDAKNYIEAESGTLEIDKKLINSTPALEGEIFEFKVSVTGTFKYGNSGYNTYTESNPFVISGINISSSTNWKWNSSEFKWYGSAPHYKVEEVIPDNADYELVDGVINNGNSYLKDGVNKIATATNKPTLQGTYIEVDKKLVSTTPAQLGETFYAHIVVTAQNGQTFSYGNQTNVTSKEIDITLDSSNNWVWKSEYISWKDGYTPTYTITEVNIPDGINLVSISDANHSTSKDTLTGTLQSENTLIIITNDEAEFLYGKIKINKLVETSDLYGKTFEFKVTVSSSDTFYYTEDGTTTKYSAGSTLEKTVSVTVPTATAENPVPTGEWLSGSFKWDEDVSAPTYTVEEINLPTGSEFVSISNGEKPITSSQSVSGTLQGNIIDRVNDDGSHNAGQVIITCINRGTGSKQAHIIILKESDDEVLDDYIFYFKVEIKGTFKYAGTQYTNTTLTLEGTLDDVEAVCGGEDWISELIEWNEGDPAPTYTVEEISIPANVEFVSISNRTTTSKTTKLPETQIVEGTENNYVTAINTPGDLVDGSIRITKKVQNEELSGQTFLFNLKIESTGLFTYNGVEYGKNNPFELNGIQVTANGNPWISGKVEWDEDQPVPTYTVTEDTSNFAQIAENVKNKMGYDSYSIEFVSISNESELTTTSHSITGSINADKAVKIVGINKGVGGPERNGSHLEITKEVLNKELAGTVFYFNLKIQSTESFTYYNNGSDSDDNGMDAVKVYNPGEVLEIKNIPVIADENDWISGYIEWQPGGVIPTYTVTEITSAFPDEVKTVTIKNDTQLIAKTLTKQSGEDLSISGTLIGDMTHIIAVNDKDTVVSEHKGSISIEKRAKSEIISGEEFTFSLTLKGNFTYQGKQYTKLTINDISVTADGPVWTSDTITWKDGVDAPTYTVTEETSKFYDGIELVSIRNAHQSNSTASITGIVDADIEVPTWVVAENDYNTAPQRGRIQIYKTLIDTEGNQIDGVEFTFDVTVGNVTKTVTVTSGSYWRSDWYYWETNESAPTYTVKEVVPSGYTSSIDNMSGTLVAEDTDNGVTGITVVKATNVADTHKSQIQINKDLIVNDKLSKNDVTASFTFQVNITGTFSYNKVVYNDKTLTLRVTISKENNWQWLSNTISWYDKAPTFDVEEPEEYMPSSWHLVSVDQSSSTLGDGQISVVDCTNEWNYEETLTLVMKLGGKVWDDTNRTLDKEADSYENGVIDEGEAGIENVKVTIYRALADKSTGNIVSRLDGVYAYDANNLVTRISNVTYTDENGNWSFGAVSVPAFANEAEKNAYGSNYVVTYDVEFAYDGQTYEPTTFLATANGDSKAYTNTTGNGGYYYQNVNSNWKTYISSSTSERDKYLYDSMAIDNADERNAFNNTFATITGNEAIDDYGNTLGTAVGSNGGTKDLHYSSVDSVSLFNSDNTRKVSTLNTTDENNEIYDEFLMTNSTSNANLTFPFYTQNASQDYKAWHLKNWDKTITDHLKITYNYEAIYNYCLSINLGLIEREAADIAVEKDLVEATVVVNGKAIKMKYGDAVNFDDPNDLELLYKQISVADAQIEYKLGLYKSDYYYRASIYDTDTETKGALQGFYNKVFNSSSYNLANTELDVYLTYNIVVHNQSETYTVTVNEIADYYDSTFELINSDEYKYIQTLNGKEVDSVTQVAHPSTVTYKDSGYNDIGTANVSWSQNGQVTGSDNVTYNKITTTSLAGTKLASGQTATIEVMFRVGKDAYNNQNIANTIKLGEKHNVAELTSFTSYYADNYNYKWGTSGSIAGRVDEDSAPGNINITSYNDKSYYEDDTDAAPMLTIYLYSDSDDREVTGTVWDDAQTDSAGLGQVVGNGIYDPNEGDKVITGLTTELYESISVPYTDANGNAIKDESGNTIYKEYQFALPTEDTNIDGLGGHSIAELTGLHQSTTTDGYGEYTFTGVPAGNYKVRFVYGDKYIETGKSGEEEVYSGEDYKSTAYQTGFDNDSDNDGLVDNEWHDLANESLSDLRVSDARDDEARRLLITSKSEMLTYDNTSVLSTADDKTANHDELFGNYSSVANTNPVTGEGYYMYAETAKLNLGVENIYSIKYTTQNIAGVDVGTIKGDVLEAGKATGTKDFSYVIKNIDCGIEERSQTKLTLDKQIKEIKLISSDGKIILDAIYDIDYSINSNGNVESSVTLNEAASTATDKIASLNRSGKTSQGYRYIMAEGTILQGTTIEVTYQLTVFNTGETDRCSTSLETLWADYNEGTNMAVLDKALEELSSPLYTEANGRIYLSASTGKYEKSQYGTYFGSVYYLGKRGAGTRADETIVKTKVHQMIDYVDPDVEFSDVENISKNQSWTNTDIEYLLNNKLIDPSIVQIVDANGNITGRTAKDSTLGNGERYSIVSDNYQEYLSETKNNIILNVVNGDNSETGSNPSLVKFIEPYMANKNYSNSTASITLGVSRFYSSETETSDIDNISEIIKLENTVGRRDVRSVAGNANPYSLNGSGDPIGIYAVASKEPDTSATEVITLTPPTGLDAATSRMAQFMLVTLVAVILVGVGIVIIKKKVLIKK